MRALFLLLKQAGQGWTIQGWCITSRMELFASSSTKAWSVSFSLGLQKWRLHLPREARKLLQSPQMTHEAPSSNAAALFRCGVVTEADNTRELLLPSWRSGMANGVIPVGKLASLTSALPISRRPNMELETTHPMGDSPRMGGQHVCFPLF